MAKTATPTKGNQTEGAKAPSEATLENGSTSRINLSTSNAPVAELDTLAGRGPLLPNAIADAMAQGLKQERNTDQRQEQQLYASVWGNFGPVLLKVIPTPAADYRRQAEQLQNQIDLLIEAKKKDKKRFDARDPRVFNQLQALLGEQAANDLVKAIDGAVAKHGAALQNNPKAVAELLTEISQALSSGGMLAKLGVSPQAVEAAVQSSILVEGVNPLVVPLRTDSDIPASTSFAEGQYLADTLSNNTADQLTSLQGIEYLSKAVLEQKSEAGRLNTLKNIKNALGDERFEQFLDTYSRLKGEALMTTLLSREGQTEAQKKQIISAYLTSERPVMPGSELARVKHGLLSKYGFARSAVQREQQEVKDMISQVEAEKAKALEHLEDLLELEGLKNLPEAQAIQKIRAALKARYPQLNTSTALSDIVTQLKEVVGSEPHKTQAKLEAIGWTGNVLSNEESESIKDNLLCISDNLLTLDTKNEELKAYQLVAREGHAGEVDFVNADFEIYKTTLGLSEQEMALNVETAELYRSGLDQRIKNASPEDREALCQERDQLDWNSIVARIEHHLRQDPPNLERAQALLSVYQISAGTSGAERTAEYRTAAESVGKTINGIEEYNKKLKACIDIEDAEVQKYLDHLKKRFNDDTDLLYNRQKALDGLYWYNDKTEAKRLVKTAKRDLGVSTARYNTSRQSGVPYNNSLGGYSKALDQTRREALQGILSPMQALPTALRRDTIEEVFDRPEILRESPADGGPDWSINDNEALNDLIKSAQALEDLFEGTAKITRELGSRRPIELPALTLETPESREALHKLHKIDTVDPTIDPSDAALEALKACVAGSDNEAFAVLNEGGTTRDRLDRLYPRLSPEDSLRVKAFLLSYDDPSMFSLFGDVPEMQNPQDVWDFLQTVSENWTAQELSGFMELLPNLHRLRKKTVLLDSLGAEDRAALDVSYSQLTSRGVGEHLIDNAPIGEARIAYLRELVRTESLSSDQLRSLFPEGRVPEGIEERLQLFDRLCLKDRESSAGDFQRFEAYLKAHVQEEGELRGALPTLIQMQRTEAALAVTRRLEELEATYQREFQSCFEGIPEDELNRRGIGSAYAATRTGLVGFAQQHAMNPNGEMYQKAFQFLKMLEREDTQFEVIEDYIRTLNFSESQMRVFEAHYSRHVATRRNGVLTGNFALDIAARNDTSQDISNLIQGGEALRKYDLEQMTEGIRTQNSTLTLRAMVAIKAREGAAGLKRHIAELNLPEKWRQVKNSDEAKLVREYIDAAVHNDTVRMGVVELANMARNGAHWAGEGTERALHTIGSWSSDRRDDAAVLYRKLTGEDLGVSLEKFGTFRKEIWNNIVSSEPAKRTGAALAIAGEAIKDGVLNLDLLNFSLSIDGVDPQKIKSFLDEKAGKMKDALTYTSGKPPTIVEYIRLRGGEMAHAEASLLEKLFEPTADIKESRALLERFVMTRDRLLFQMEQADRLHAKRSEVLVGSQEFFVNVVGSYNRSAKDADERYINRGYARDVRDIDRVMYDDQRDLLRGHHLAMGDIESTREIMRVRSVALLTDLVENRDRGLSADSNDRDFRDLRIRDSKHEWVIARREVVERWARESEIARKKLADADWWVDTSISVAKVAVVIGVACIPGVGIWTALAVATALNAAEKAYFYAARGMDIEKALLAFGGELVFDIATLGMGRFFKLLPFGNVVAKGAGELLEQGARESLEQVGKEVVDQVAKKTVDQVGKRIVEQGTKEAVEQVAKEVVEQGAKKGAREVLELGARESLEQVGKEVVEHGTKEAVEQIVKEIGEQGAKEVVEQVGAKGLDQVARETVEQVTREILERVARETVEQATRESLELVVKEALEQVVHQASDKVAKEALKRLGNEALEQVSKEVLERTGKKITERVAKEALEQVIQETLEQVAKESVEQVAKKGLEQFAKEAFEKVGKEAMERTIRAALEPLVKEAGEQVIKETLEQVAKETSEQVARGRLTFKWPSTKSYKILQARNLDELYGMIQDLRPAWRKPAMKLYEKLVRESVDKTIPKWAQELTSSQQAATIVLEFVPKLRYSGDFGLGLGSLLATIFNSRPSTSEDTKPRLDSARRVLPPGRRVSSLDPLDIDSVDSSFEDNAVIDPTSSLDSDVESSSVESTATILVNEESREADEVPKASQREEVASVEEAERKESLALEKESLPITSNDGQEERSEDPERKSEHESTQPEDPIAPQVGGAGESNSDAEIPTIREQVPPEKPSEASSSSGGPEPSNGQDGTPAGTPTGGDIPGNQPAPKEERGPSNDRGPGDDPTDPPASDPIPVSGKPEQEVPASLALRRRRQDSLNIPIRHQDSLENQSSIQQASSNSNLNTDANSQLKDQSQANAGVHMHGVRQAEAAKEQQARSNADSQRLMQASLNLAAESEANRNMAAHNELSAEAEREDAQIRLIEQERRVQQTDQRERDQDRDYDQSIAAHNELRTKGESETWAQIQSRFLEEQRRIEQKRQRERGQEHDLEREMSRFLKNVDEKDADGLKVPRTQESRDMGAHDLLEGNKATDINGDEYIDDELIKNEHAHEEAQMRARSEREIIAQQSQETEVRSQLEQEISHRALKYEERILAEALSNNSGGGANLHPDAQIKLQQRSTSVEVTHSASSNLSGIKEQAISTIIAKAGVERVASEPLQQVEGGGGIPSFGPSEVSISKNTEKLIATLSDQVGSHVHEAASFLAGLDEAPKMMTADRSSQSLLDGSTIDVANAISEVGDAMDLPRMKSADAKRKGIRRAKNRREIEVLIQVLLTRQIEASKRQKLLRMLLALGISEVEYRALVAKLGEMEVASQAMAAEAEKASHKERQALMVEPLLREPEAPKMKPRESDSLAPPKMKTAHATTRGAIYERLLKEKEKSST